MLREGKNIKPGKFLTMMFIFALFSVLISRSIHVNAIEIIEKINQEVSPQRIQQNSNPQVKSSSNVCGTPITIYEDTLSCPQTTSSQIDFGQRNGGSKSGQIVYSKNMEAKVYSITKPTTLLSGSDIPNTAPVLKKDSLIVPSADAFFTEKHFDYGKYPGQATPKHSASPYSSVGEVKFAELDSASQEFEYVEDEYRVSNTQECASCKSDPTSSNMYAKTLRSRMQYPNQGNDSNVTASLACSTPNSINVNASRVACVDERVSFLKRLTSFFSDTAWIDCNTVKYDEEGNVISDGRCIDTKDITLELNGVFDETNNTFKTIVHSSKAPIESSEYNGELKYIFPAKIQVDGRIYSVNASINAPAEYYRNLNASINVPGDSVSAQLFKAFLKFWGDQDSSGIFYKL